MFFYHHKRIFYYTILFMLTACSLATSCSKSDPDEGSIRNVLILYSAGYNDLSNYLTEDIEDMMVHGYVPSKKGRDILLIIGRRTARYNDYKTPSAPCLYRIFRQSGKVVRDTLFSLEGGKSIAEPGAMKTLLGKAVDLFPSRHYGMVFSSHGSGWLPEGFFANPDSFKSKSAGAEFYDPEGTEHKTYEIEINDMAAAIPMHLDYLLFDACLMGGVEVAWALKEVTDYIGFSQTEILGDGFDYTGLAGHLLQAAPDPEAVCKDYYMRYKEQKGWSRSATISLIRTEGLEGLAQACKPLFEQYRTQIGALKASDVQCFGGGKTYFYDLTDILRKAGATNLAAVETALDKCIVFKAATEKYYSKNVGNTLPIHAFCGLSMYLPSPSVVTIGKAYLDEYYRTLGWNQATGLVK